MTKCLYCDRAFNDGIINPKTKELYQTCRNHRGSTPKEKRDNEEMRSLGITKQQLGHRNFFFPEFTGEHTLEFQEYMIERVGKHLQPRDNNEQEYMMERLGQPKVLGGLICW